MEKIEMLKSRLYGLARSRRAQIADDMGVSEATLSSRMMNQETFKISEINRLAEILQKPVSEFIVIQ